MWFCYLGSCKRVILFQGIPVLNASSYSVTVERILNITVIIWIGNRYAVSSIVLSFVLSSKWCTWKEMVHYLKKCRNNVYIKKIKSTFQKRKEKKYDI